jgi:plasmid stability protein
VRSSVSETRERRGGCYNSVLLLFRYTFDIMPGLLIKDLPKELHQKLKTRASVNRRSLSNEAIIILEDALRDRPRRLTLEEIDRLRVRPRRPLTQAILDEALRKKR